jgi:WD40 repeat protein
VAARELDQGLLKSRVDFLESALCGRDRENSRLQARLLEAELRLSQLGGATPSPSRYSLSRIPEDVVGRILEYAGTRELGVVGCADRHLNQFASLDRLWRAHYQHEWGRNKYCSMEEKKKEEEGKDTPVLKKSWKAIFAEKQIIESNWKRQRCNVTNLMAHNGTVTCIALRKNRMFSGSDDGSLICWAIDEGPADDAEDSGPRLVPPPALPLAQLVDSMSCGASLSGSGSESFHHQLHKKKGSQKRVCAKTRTFHGHGGPVWALDYDEATDYLYSGSYDQTIKVWDIKTQACRRTLRGHTGWVSSLALIGSDTSAADSSLLASASWDATIRLWRVGEGVGDDNDGLDQGYRVMNAGQGNALYCIGIGDGGRVVNVGCRHHQIQRWDTDREALVGSLLGHAREVQALHAVGGTIVSGSGDSTAKLWDVLTDKCCITLRGHTDSVMAVQV